jgi:AraC-type DNA-binding domain-containing proteins
MPTIIIAIGSYYIGTWQIEKELEKNQKLQIEQNDSKISDQLKMLEQIVVKWSFNSDFTNMLKINNINTDYENVINLYSTLTLIKNSHSLIGDVALYLKDKNIIITEAGVVNLKEEQKSEISKLTESQKDFYYMEETKSSIFNEEQTMNILLICKVHNLYQTESASIIVSLNKKSVDDLLSQLMSDKNDISFILYPNGSTYMPVSEHASRNQLVEDQIVKNITKSEKASDVLLQKFNGEMYSISYSTYNQNGWKFIVATPLSKMLEPVKTTSRLLLLISLFTFLFIVFGSLFLTRRIYKPVEQLTHFLTERIDEADSYSSESRANDEFSFIQNNVIKINQEKRELKAYLEKNKIILRDSFLFQLIQGNLNYYTEAELRETMKRMGWELCASEFVVAFIKLFIPKSSGAKFNHGDEQLATYAAVNIIEETLSNDARVLGIINFHNLSIALILESDNNESNINGISLEDTYKLIMERLNGYLEMQVVTGVSKRVELVKDIAVAFNEAFQSIRYRDVDNKSEIIFAEDLVQEPYNTVRYPVDIENEIVYDIKMDMSDDIGEKIWKFIDELKKTSGKEFFIQQGMLHLLGSVLHAMIQSGADINTLYSGKNLYEQMCQIKEPNEMAAWFMESLLEPFLKENRRTQEIKYKEIVNSVKEYIQNNYTRDISLDICSEALGIPARRLTVLFYKITGINFVEYVIDFRLKKAKELLKETDESIINISFMVGYQPQYFNKIFKKKEGITPGEFRRIYR